MRRQLIVYATAALVFFVFSDLTRKPPRAAAQNVSAGAAAPKIVASGIDARALAVERTLAAGESPLYFASADQANRIFALDLRAGAKVSTIAGIGAAGSLGDGGAASAAELNLKFDSLIEASGIAAAPDGTLFIADTRNRTIRRVAGAESSEPGVIRSVAGRWAPPQNIELVEPMGLALDRAGNLYIADHGANSILLLRAATSTTPGPLEMLAHVIAPAHVAVTLDGARLFAASPETGALVEVATATRALTQIFAPRTAAISGVVPATPTGLAVDGGGNLFVSDAIRNEIFRIASQSSAPMTVATSVHSPGAMAIDAQGNLFVADQARHEILEFPKLGQATSNLSLAPASRAFGNEPRGGLTAQTAFLLANNSASAATNVTIGFTGANPNDFPVQSTSCTATLAANSNCTINLAFAPADLGARAATLGVTDANPSDSASASLTGTGDDFNLAAAGTPPVTSITVKAGKPATYMMQVAPDNVFTGTVTLVPPGNPPTGVTTTFSAATVNVTQAGMAVPFQVTFHTTSSTGMSGYAPGFFRGPGNFPGAHFPALLLLGIFAAFAALALRAAREGRPGTRRLIHIFALGIAAAALLGGCRGYGSSTSPSTTPAGTYTLLVQGTAQGASRGFTLTLIVQ